MLLPMDRQIYAFTRNYRGQSLLVVANFSATQMRANVPDEDRWARSELVLGNYPAATGRSNVPDDQILLRPWEARIYRDHP
jgi:oligo-1,6-glucosidase